MEWLRNILVRTVNLGRVKDPVFFSRPVLSSVYERAIETGTDACDPTQWRAGAMHG